MAKLYIGSEDEYIQEINLDYYDYDARYTGIELKTNNNSLKFLIEDGQFCYETFGVAIKIDNKLCDPTFRFTQSTLYNHNFESLGVDSIIGDNIEYIQFLRDFNYDDDMTSVDIFIKTDLHNIFICIYNIHNGYYPHDYKLDFGTFQDHGKI